MGELYEGREAWYCVYGEEGTEIGEEVCTWWALRVWAEGLGFWPAAERRLESGILRGGKLCLEISRS